jgi:hypothetical protein
MVYMNRGDIQSKVPRRWEYRNIKVKPETYKRLRYYQNLMELQTFQRGDEVRYTMDGVIKALLDLLESAKIKITTVEAEEGRNNEKNKSAEKSV